MELLTFLENELQMCLLIFPRIVGLFIFMPGLSSKSINKKVKILIIFSLSLLLSQFSTEVNIESYYIFIIKMIAELLIGTLVGLISSLFIQIINIMGSLVDSLLGTGVFQISDASGQSMSASVKLIEYLALLLFFSTNMHLYIIRVIGIDIDFMKLYNVFLNENFLILIIKIFEFMFVNAVHLSMPFIILFLTVDISLGIINRSFSSFNVFLFSMPLKMLVYVILLFFYILFFKENFSNILGLNFDIISNFLELLQ